MDLIDFLPQENRDKLKAEAVEFSSLHVPVNLEQTVQDEPLNFSMDDFEGESLWVVKGLCII